jgi:hypothetical protein
MPAVTPHERAPFVTIVAKHAVSIAVVAIALFAFHWQSLHADAETARERAEERARTLSETASLAMIQPLTVNDAPSMMIFLEELVRSNHDVQSASVAGKDGKTIASTQAEGIDASESSAARDLKQPILVHGAGPPFAIGTLDLRLSTKDVQLAAATGTIAIEGVVCLLVCGGLFALSRKREPAPASSPTKGTGGERSAPTGALTKSAEPASSPAKRADGERSATTGAITKSAEPASSPTKRTDVDRSAPSVAVTKSAEPVSSSRRRDPLAPEPRGPRPSNTSSDDEPVEVKLDSPPSAPPEPR